MGKTGRFALFTLWLLLIPLPLFYPLITFDYSPYYDQFSSFSLYPNFVVATVIFAVGWGGVSRSDLFRPLTLTIPLGLLCLLTAFSIGYAAVDGRLAAIVLARLLIAFALYVTLKSNWLDQYLIFNALILFLCVQGGIAAAQFWLQDDLGLAWLGELDLEPVPGGGSIIFGVDEYWLRGYGLAPHPNILGGMAGSALLIVLFGPYAQKVKQVVLFLGCLGLLVTFSRSAWVGTAFGLMVGLLFRLFSMFKQQMRLDAGGAVLVHKNDITLTFRRFVKSTLLQSLPLLLAIAIFLGGAWGPLQARSQPQENQVVTQSVGERQLLTDIAYDFIGDHFWLGLGAGNFGPAMLDHPNREMYPNIHPVHNLPLLLTAELGILGGVTWVWLMLFPIGYGGYVLWHANGRLDSWSIALIAGLSVFIVIDLFDYYSWGWPHGLTWRWMLFALLGQQVSGVQDRMSSLVT